MPTQLDAELITTACKRVSLTGEYPQRVLVHMGVSGPTASRWLSRGEQLDQEGADPEPMSMDELCLALARGMDAAEAHIENFWSGKLDEAIRMCQKEGKGNAWQGWMTRLERRFPDRYKRVSAEKAQASWSFDDLVKRRSSSST